MICPVLFEILIDFCLPPYRSPSFLPPKIERIGTPVLVRPRPPTQNQNIRTRLASSTMWEQCTKNRGSRSRTTLTTHRTCTVFLSQCPVLEKNNYHHRTRYCHLHIKVTSFHFMAVFIDISGAPTLLFPGAGVESYLQVL